MLAVNTRSLSLALASGILLTAATGCVATRKFVRNEVSSGIAPVDNRVKSLEAKTTEQGTHLETLDRGVARLDETTKAIDAKATTAGRDAKTAQDAASAADAKGAAAQNAATGATQVARTADTKATEANTRLSKLEDYKVVAEDSILFAYGKDILTDDAKSQLMAVASKVGGLKRFAIEVQGFTDSTGDSNYNLGLSERRANTVVRFLNTEVKVPLHRISVLGVGEIVPEKGVKQTAEMRKANRRVEVRIFSAD
jgi:outer membrane protein OmpA-like peptidoglycan-associated protein